MPAYIELPNEILYTIIDNVHPDDIINLSLCCQKIHLLAKSAVSLHLQRMKTFRDGHIILNGCHRHRNDFSPLRLIRDICMDWRVGEYPTDVLFSCCHHPMEGPNLSPEGKSLIEMDTKEWMFEKNQDTEFIHETMHVIQDEIEEKGREFGFDVKEWFGLIMNGNRAVMLAILFWFIPRLEFLCLSNFTHDALCLDSAIRSMPEQPGVKRFLTNLTAVYLMGDARNHHGEELGSFMTFAAFPSVRRVTGEFVQGISEPIPRLTNPSNTSNITEITLDKSFVDAKNLTQLLVGIKSLKRFSLEQSRRMELHKIVAALLRHAKHSLECLQIVGSCENDDDIDSRILQHFEVLKRVRLSFLLYVDLLLPCEGLSESGCYRKRVQPLVYALPPSIESVSLVGPVFTHASTILADFATEKHARLPELKKVELFDDGSKCDEGWAKTLEEMCENMGVTLRTERC